MGFSQAARKSMTDTEESLKHRKRFRHTHISFRYTHNSGLLCELASTFP